MKRPTRLGLAFSVTWALIIILIVIGALILVKDSSNKAEVNNYIGKSAYELAIDKGFKGTETMWLESLKAIPAANGTNGNDGENGKDSVSTNTTETNTIQKETTVEKQVPINGNDGRTPELAQDATTNQLLYRYQGDDEWLVLPKICLGVSCGQGQ